MLDTTWRNYGVAQSRGALPAGPMVIFVHMASVWVPFTSESKEAIADYDEIQKRNQARSARMRPAARCFSAAARARQGRISPAQYFRALHRRSRRSLQPAQRAASSPRKNSKNNCKRSPTNAPAAKKPMRFSARRRRAGRSAALDYRHRRGHRRRGAHVPSNEQNAVEAPQEIAADEQEPALPYDGKGKGQIKNQDKNEATKVTKQHGAQAGKYKANDFGFEKAKSSEGRSRKTGKKHGAKKTKK